MKTMAVYGRTSCCAKCQHQGYEPRYDPVVDVLILTCGRCWFQWPEAPLDFAYREDTVEQGSEAKPT